MKIKDVNVEDRPREKLQRYGVKALSNRELIALLLRSGTKTHSALDLADQVLHKSKGILGLAQCEMHDFMSIEGIKEAKASELCAIGECARRMAFEASQGVSVIDQPQRVVHWLQSEIGHCMQENFLVVFLNTKNHIIGYRPLYVGGLDRSIVHPREVFKQAVAHSAARILVVHNHPSGDVTPSENDFMVTSVLEEAGQTMGIPLLDHLIVSKQRYLSLKEVVRKD